MMGRMKLGYLAFDVTRLEAWTDFATQVLGLMPAGGNADGSAGFRLDAAAHRVIVSRAKRDDIGAIGFELENAAALDELRARLSRAGVSFVEGDAELRSARRVERLIAFADPEGTPLEAVLGLQRTDIPFVASEPVKQGFHSDDTGFGHAALVARNLEVMERFYAGTLGFGVTERLASQIGPLEMRGLFLHCNRRHHTIALFALPLKRKLQHFMLEARSVVDVLRAHERCRNMKVPFSLELGQHSDPDGTVSFYGISPSGFEFEIGGAGKTITPEGWAEVAQSVGSEWGHKPTPGMMLSSATSMLRSKLGL